MFIVKFDTKNAATSSKRRDWERQLMDDYIRAIDGKEFHCNGQPPHA